jgi:putative transposase
MLNRPKTILFWREKLPHWEVIDGRYFVTLRLHGSLPAHIVEELQAMTTGLSEHSSGGDYSLVTRKIFACMEDWLHQPTNINWLQKPEIAQMVADSVSFFHEHGFWSIIEYVIMPNHVHLFFHPGSLGMTDALKRFKQWTAREGNRILGTKGERFWQEEWFDHWSRSAIEDERIRSYIRNNPTRAKRQ